MAHYNKIISKRKSNMELLRSTNGNTMTNPFADLVVPYPERNICAQVESETGSMLDRRLTLIKDHSQNIYEDSASDI